MTVKHLFPAVEPSLNLDFANSKKLDPRITFTRSSTGTYVDSNGVIKTAAANEARFDHDPVSGSSLGLLVEEGRTNYAKSSENISLVSNWSGWAGGEFVVTPNATTAPDGTSTATLIKDVATSGNRSIKNTSMSSLPSSVYTVSCFFKKAGNGNTVSIFYNNSPYDGIYDFNLDSPSSLHQNYSIAYPNGWYRVWFTTISARTNMSSVSINAGSANGTTNAEVYMWGFQVEPAFSPTSYIPTSATTVTRAADLASMPAADYSYGTFVATYKHLVPLTVNHRHVFGTFRSSGQTTFECRGMPDSAFYNGGAMLGLPNVEDVVQTANAETTGFNTVAVARVVGDYGICLNGGAVATSTSTSDNTNNDVLKFKYGRNGLDSSGYLSRFAYYPFRLTDAQLQALTV